MIKASRDIVIENIIRIKDTNNIATYAELAKRTSINLNTLKAWLSYSRIPRLQNIDILCNSFNIHTSLLFIQDSSFSPTFDGKNNSRERFRVNLKKNLLEKVILNSNDILALFEGEISREEYFSYIRNSNGRCIPLEKLDIISQHLCVEPFTLLI